MLTSPYRKKFTATAMIVNLYHILDGMDIENYRNGNHEEFLSKFDFNTRNVLNPTDKPIVAFLYLDYFWKHLFCLCSNDTPHFFSILLKCL